MGLFSTRTTSELNLIASVLAGIDVNTNYFTVAQSDLYDGDNNYIRIGGTIAKSSNLSNQILKKISQDNMLLDDICKINTGIQTGADKVTLKHMENYQIDEPFGKGIFVLSDNEIADLDLNGNENSLLKPYFKNSDIYRWGVNSNNLEKIIYYCSKENYNNIDNIKQYLEKFKIILVNRNVRAGKVTLEQYDRFLNNKFEISYVMIASEMKKGNYYCLSYARNESIFESPKIVVSQRTKENIFGYTEKSLYGGSGVFFINEKNSDFNLKFILSLLNSKLYYYWLYHKGKRKVDLLEIIVKPLSEIPIKNTSKEHQKLFIKIVNQILDATSVDPTTDIAGFENEIDKLVYELYGLTNEEIKIVEEL